MMNPGDSKVFNCFESGTSQNVTVLPSEMANFAPSGEKAEISDFSSVLKRVASLTRHNSLGRCCSVNSKAGCTNKVEPSGEKAAHETMSSCVTVRRSAPSLVRRSCRVVPLGIANTELSGLKNRSPTRAEEELLTQRSSVPSATCHNQTALSSPSAASLEPSGEKSTWRIELFVGNARTSASV